MIIGPQEKRYTIHEGILSRYPQLKRVGDSDLSGFTIELPEVYENNGHTLVHYLFTQTYQSLSLQSDGGNVDELKRIANLCAIATKYKIDGLMIMSQAKIQEIADAVAIFEVLAAAKEFYRVLKKEDAWFAHFIKGKIHAALASDANFLTTDRFLELCGGAKTFDRSLLRIVAEICTENMAIRFQKTPDSSRSNSLNQISVEAPTCHRLSIASAEPVPCEEPVPCGEPVPCEEPVQCEEPFALEELTVCEKSLPCEEPITFEMNIPGDEYSSIEEPSVDIPDLPDIPRKSKDKGKLARERKAKGKAKSGFDWGSWGSTNPLAEAVPLATFICRSRVEHLNGDAWKDCSECRALLHELSLRMPDED